MSQVPRNKAHLLSYQTREETFPQSVMGTCTNPQRTLGEKSERCSTATYCPITNEYCKADTGGKPATQQSPGHMEPLTPVERAEHFAWSVRQPLPIKDFFNLIQTEREGRGPLWRKDPAQPGRREHGKGEVGFRIQQFGNYGAKAQNCAIQAKFHLRSQRLESQNHGAWMQV